MKPDAALFAAYDDYVPRDSALSEKNLMRAILRTAFEDMKRRGEAYRQARSYFLSNDISYVFSFLSICYSLNLCPRTIRTRLGLIDPHRERMAA